ncbi:MAG: hypothetical protein MPJ50_09155 [Pirellulales bacterium]|nr:hypothetical protein [Pirellulales bacterium]
MKFSLASVAVLTLFASSASAQLFERMPKLWQPEILQAGFLAPQDPPAPTPATGSGELVLPEGATIVDGHHSGPPEFHGSYGCGCNSYNHGCEPSPCCGGRKSFRLFSGSLFRKSSCCEPVCDTCDPCAKRGWLDRLFSCGARRDCHYEQSCCEPAPNCGCGFWKLPSLFNFGRRCNHSCNTCGHSQGYAPYGESYFQDGHQIDGTLVTPPQPLPGTDLPLPADKNGI